ncbi:hypothetical protein QR680_005592 [Steinernema hermaphroditum]|uniref:HIT-type domain-containing protein n=1 Tax=Steinernema hermaphroditum TaxID=289476 RepID=A0AA39LVN7_9BILA|nr:hypothetical protein QR680_005592 [Steinernema hermaphroditum]
MDEEQVMLGTGAAGLGTSLCEQCEQQKFIYRCPKCAMKTCSLSCSKQHKMDKNCDGTRQPYDEVKKFSEYDDAASIRDQKFFSDIRSTLGSEQLSQRGNGHSVVKEEVEGISQENTEASGLPENSEEQSLSSVDRYLLSACHRRHVWLKFGKDHVADGSRHEQFSDTVMWTVDMKFLKEDEPVEADSVDKAEVQEGEFFVNDSTPTEVRKPVTEYVYTVHGIPDSLTVSTLLRQFVKPKKVGPVVSRSDLDEQKMTPFFDAAMENVVMYMKVPAETMERYYCIDTSKSILDNLRNRIVIDHPVFIVTLGRECHGFTTLSEQEAQELRDSQRSEYQKQRASSGRGGRGRGGRGGNRGGFRGGFRGGKRPQMVNADDGDRRGGKFPRRGRGQTRYDFDPLDMSNAAMRRCGAFKHEN